MAKLSKNQRDLVVLGALLAAIAGVLVWMLSRGGEEQASTYQPRSLDTAIDTELFTSAEFRRLRSNVDLPLDPGAKGRENPFAPYGAAPQ